MRHVRCTTLSWKRTSTRGRFETRQEERALGSDGNIKFQELLDNLRLSPAGGLSLNGLPMVLMPLHFFRYILREVRDAVSAETFSDIYWQAGYDGAIGFCEAFEKSHSCTPQEAVRGYLEEMSLRGWGLFSIQSMEPEKGTMEVLLRNSALASGGGIPSGNLAWEGAMVGAMAYLQTKLAGTLSPSLHARGLEGRCRNAGAVDFTISVMPRPFEEKRMNHG
jgi:Domain of unknown function (DUF5943)